MVPESSPEARKFAEAMVRMGFRDVLLFQDDGVDNIGRTIEGEKLVFYDLDHYSIPDYLLEPPFYGSNSNLESGIRNLLSLERGLSFLP